MHPPAPSRAAVTSTTSFCSGGDDMMMYDSLMDDGYAADVVWDDMD